MLKLSNQYCRNKKRKSLENHALLLIASLIISYTYAETLYRHTNLAFQVSNQSDYRQQIKSRRSIESHSDLAKHQTTSLQLHKFSSKHYATRFNDRKNESYSIHMNLINDDDISSSTSSPLEPSSNSISNAIAFIRQCGKLKRTPRTGWINRNIHEYVGNVESVADHSWRVSIMSLLLFSDLSKVDNFNVQKCMQMALFHDLAECITGDICPDDNISKDEKYNLEKNAIMKLSKLLNESRLQNKNNCSGDERTVEPRLDSQIKEDCNDASQFLRNLWNEYEIRETEEAKAVKDLDLLDMIVQADEYEQMISQDCDILQEFFDGTMPNRFHNNYVRKLAEEIHYQRHQRLNANIDNNCDDEPITHSLDSGSGTQFNFKELSDKDNEFVLRFANSSDVPAHIVKNIIQAYIKEKDNSI